MASTSTFLMVGFRSNCLIAFTLLFAMARFRRAFRFNSVTAMTLYVFTMFVYWGRWNAVLPKHRVASAISPQK
jgi:TRAP-type C4-dicarboxylate transport system permease small subunit